MVEANILRDYRIGNTRIKIADNFCRTTETEIDGILSRIAHQARMNIIAAASTGSYDETATTN